jgi:hypothetical protein
MGSVRVDEGKPARGRWRSTVPARPFMPGEPPERPEPETSGAESPKRDDPELDRILKMVEAGELSAHDADELLRAMGRV